MKKICLMSGAVINAGDFLIEKRTYDLLANYVDEPEITILNRVDTDYSKKIELINSFDAIVFGGGPFYHPLIYPNSIPFVRDLRQVKAPVMFLGGGLYTGIYTSNLSTQSRRLFEFGSNLFPLGCRDVYTYWFLKNQGFQKLLMTGCPAWYSLQDIDNLYLKSHHSHNLKICVSEPANDSNVLLLERLLQYISKRFNDSQIYLVIHRENKKGINAIANVLLEKYNIKTTQISNSVDGFNIYNDCDLHIGFRVHAHIYNLSIRNKSILISEDVRGHGMCHVMGLGNIDKFPDTFPKQKRIFGGFYLTYSPCKYSKEDLVINKIDDYLEYCEIMNNSNYIDAFTRMRKYFDVMLRHVQMLNQI